MEVNLFDPNPAIAAVLISGEMRAIVEERTKMAQLLYQAQVAKRTGRLAASAHVQVEVGGVHNDRIVGHMIVGGAGSQGTVDYGAAHQFGHWQDEGHLIGRQQSPGESHVFVEGAHDLNRVLEELSGI
jgi:hypothetical protein